MLKISTEDEGLTHDEVRVRRDLFSDELIVELKVGGASARGDLKLCKEIGVNHLIFPMVETPYAMEQALESVEDVFGSRWNIHIGLNIETVTASRNARKILDKSADKLKQVTVGRTDLSRSLGLPLDSEKVNRRTRRILAEAGRRKLHTSVGGGIMPGNIAALREKTSASGFNTRNFAFRFDDFHSNDELFAAVSDALRVEIILCGLGGRSGETRRRALQKRLETGGASKPPESLIAIASRAGVKRLC